MKNLLEVSGLDKSLGGKPVLRGLAFNLQAGEFAGLIGPNGSGKSTLMRCLCGVLPADAGRIVIEGHVLGDDPRAARHRLGYAVDPALLPAELDGRQCLELVAQARGLAAVPVDSFNLARQLGLDRYLDAIVASYSLGTRQKLSVVLALLGQPPLLLLDESLNGLDPISALALKEHLAWLARERGCAVLLATHSLEIAEFFLTRASLLLGGRLVRDWHAQELEQLRHAPGQSLERAVVEVLRSSA